MKKVAVILSGCGVFDGSEIHESTLTLLALDRMGLPYHCLAPDITQHHVVNHLTQTEMPENRNVLVESARIARGNISNIAEVNPDDYSAAILPGGFGAAKNLSNFAFAANDCTVNPELARFTQQIHKARKPLGFICISPVMIPKLLGEGIQCTIGSDEATAAAIDSMGGEHVNCAVDGIVVDAQHRVISTPAYMFEKSISQVFLGIEKLVAEIATLLGSA